MVAVSDLDPMHASRMPDSMLPLLSELGLARLLD